MQPTPFMPRPANNVPDPNKNVRHVPHARGTKDNHRTFRAVYSTFRTRSSASVAGVAARSRLPFLLFSNPRATVRPMTVMNERKMKMVRNRARASGYPPCGVTLTWPSTASWHHPRRMFRQMRRTRQVRRRIEVHRGCCGRRGKKGKKNKS